MGQAKLRGDREQRAREAIDREIELEGGEFILQGMDKFAFRLVMPYQDTMPSCMFAVIAARELALDAGTGGHYIDALTDLNAFINIAFEQDQRYIDNAGVARALLFVTTRNYLDKFPDARIEAAWRSEMAAQQGRHNGVFGLDHLLSQRGHARRKSN